MKQLKIGDKAPSFSAKDQSGKSISLNDFSGKRLVIYFYPKDNTPGCTTQACNLRDNYASLLKNGISIVGVSADDEKSHEKFVRKFDLPFSLLADTDRKIIESYGVWGEKKFMGRVYDGIHRTTFLLNEDHTILAIIEKPVTKNHAEEILAFYN